MKKIVLLFSVIFSVLACCAQYQKSDLKINPKLYNHYTQTEIEQMYQNDFAQLFRLNFKMNSYVMFGTKDPGGNSKTMGYLSDYAKKGVVVNEEEIIRTGQVDPFDFELPQDDSRINVFMLHRSGYYIFVASKQDYNNVVEAQLNQFAY